MAKYTEDDLREDLKTKEYEAGFYTDIEYEDFPVGLNEEIVRMISAKKQEPEWMTNWRLESFRIWQKMEEPDWANIQYEKPDFQAIKYYAAPKVKPELASLDEVDPELLKTFEKLGINIEEQKRLAGVAVDIVMDSVSVKTTFQATLKEKGIIFCSISEAIKNHPDLVQKYIINPKKGDKDFNKEKKPPMDNGTFKLIAVLVLVIGFTAGIGYGVLTFDFGNISVTDAQAIVEDTAFPEVEEVKVNDTDNDSVQVGDTYTSDNSYDSGDSSSGQGSGSYDSGTGGEESGSGGSSGSGDSGTVEGTVTG